MVEKKRVRMRVDQAKIHQNVCAIQAIIHTNLADTLSRLDTLGCGWLLASE